MELNEALHRIVVGHWRLLLICTLLPVLVIGLLQARHTPGYAAVARVQASSAPPTTTTEADSVLNRAQGIATSNAVVQKSMHQAQVTGRSVDQVVREIDVSRIGTSAVLNVKVTDPDPKIATALDNALAPQLVNYLNDTVNSNTAALAAQLTAQQNTLLAQRGQLNGQLALSQSATTTARLSSQLAVVEQQLNNVQSTLSQVQSLATAGNSTAAMISPATGAVAAKTSWATVLGLAALLGLVIGLLAATVTETLRPRVADAAAFAREIDAPLLGPLHVRAKRGAGPDGVELELPLETLLAARRAVTRSAVETLVLTGPDPEGRLPLAAEQLERALGAGAVPAGPPSGWNGHGGSATPNHDGLTGATGTGSLARTLEASLRATLADDLPHRLRVRALTELSEAQLAGARPAEGERGSERPDRHGLLVLVPALTPHQEVRRIRQLAAGTGWPVVGVLGTALRRPSRGERRVARHAERSARQDRRLAEKAERLAEKAERRAEKKARRHGTEETS